MNTRVASAPFSARPRVEAASPRPSPAPGTSHPRSRSSDKPDDNRRRDLPERLCDRVAAPPPGPAGVRRRGRRTRALRGPAQPRAAARPASSRATGTRNGEQET
ncbi:hypothetical protein GCM10009834_04890 [Streptomonospora arabica]